MILQRRLLLLLLLCYALAWFVLIAVTVKYPSGNLCLRRRIYFARVCNLEIKTNKLVSWDEMLSSAIKILNWQSIHLELSKLLLIDCPKMEMTTNHVYCGCTFFLCLKIITKCLKNQKKSLKYIITSELVHHKSIQVIQCVKISSICLVSTPFESECKWAWLTFTFFSVSLSILS